MVEEKKAVEEATSYRVNVKTYAVDTTETEDLHRALDDADAAIDLGGVGTELRRPFDTSHVAHHEPALLVLDPEPAAVVVLVGLIAEEPVRLAFGLLVRRLAGVDVLLRVSSSRMIGDADLPRSILLLGVRRPRGRLAAPLLLGWSRLGLPRTRLVSVGVGRLGHGAPPVLAPTSQAVIARLCSSSPVQ